MGAVPLWPNRHGYRLGRCGRKLPRAHGDYGVVFVSSELDLNEVRDFIRDSKELLQSRDSAFVLTATGGTQDSSSLASCLMYGADAFLFEPYLSTNL